MRILILLMLILMTACAGPATPIPPGAQPPTPPPPAAPVITQADQAVVAAQQKFPELKDIKKTPPGTIGASTNITVLDQSDGWNIVFWQGSGDCPAGCINHHFWYVTVAKDGAITLAGEYAREFDGRSNTFITRGAPLWGIPRQ